MPIKTVTITTDSDLLHVLRKESKKKGIQSQEMAIVMSNTKGVSITALNKMLDRLDFRLFAVPKESKEDKTIYFINLG
jgi:hypothetical protein